MDEFLFPGCAVALALWAYWYYSFLKIVSFHRDKMPSRLIGITAPVCMLILLLVLLNWSSPDVRSNHDAILLYMILGALWPRLAMFLLALTGVSVRDDVLERRNRSAAWTACGAMFGASFSFAGANIGRGPGPEAVLFCATISTAGLFGLWLGFERIARLSDRITIERDEGIGIRMCGWWASAGLILGSAVEGGWKSSRATLSDFAHFGWVAVLLLLAGLLIEWFWRARSAATNQMQGGSWSIAATYCAVAGGYAWLTAR
jgi:hypothetical protein